MVEEGGTTCEELTGEQRKQEDSLGRWERGESSKMERLGSDVSSVSF